MGPKLDWMPVRQRAARCRQRKWSGYAIVDQTFAASVDRSEEHEELSSYEQVEAEWQLAEPITVLCQGTAAMAGNRILRRRCAPCQCTCHQSAPVGCGSSH